MTELSLPALPRVDCAAPVATRTAYYARVRRNYQGRVSALWRPSETALDWPQIGWMEFWKSWDLEEATEQTASWPLTVGDCGARKPELPEESSSWASPFGAESSHSGRFLRAKPLWEFPCGCRLVPGPPRPAPPPPPCPNRSFSSVIWRPLQTSHITQYGGALRRNYHQPPGRVASQGSTSSRVMNQGRLRLRPRA